MKRYTPPDLDSWRRDGWRGPMRKWAYCSQRVVGWMPQCRAVGLTWGVWKAGKRLIFWIFRLWKKRSTGLGPRKRQQDAVFRIIFFHYQILWWFQKRGKSLSRALKVGPENLENIQISAKRRNTWYLESIPHARNTTVFSYMPYSIFVLE